MAKISVLGSGGWGTAIAVMLFKNGHSVKLWSYQKSECEDLKLYKENKPYLPGIILPDGIEFTCDLSLCADADVVVTATPSHAVRQTAKSFAPFAKDGTVVLNISKGIEEESSKTLSVILEEELPVCKIAVMSGPSHAEEVSRGIPTTNVVAAKDPSVARLVQDIFMNPDFRIYTNSDITGVELGGSLKNVYALCCGIIEGMGFGDNTKAALMTRGLVEMKRLGIKMGAKEETFSGLSGMGDLIVTCTSVHSRNKRAGILIGQGVSPKEAQNKVKMVVEGIRTCRAAKELADKMQVEMPIVNEAYDVLFCGGRLDEVIPKLMGRSKKNESEFEFLSK